MNHLALNKSGGRGVLVFRRDIQDRRAAFSARLAGFSHSHRVTRCMAPLRATLTALARHALPAASLHCSRPALLSGPCFLLGWLLPALLLTVCPALLTVLCLASCSCLAGRSCLSCPPMPRRQAAPRRHAASLQVAICSSPTCCVLLPHPGVHM